MFIAWYLGTHIKSNGQCHRSTGLSCLLVSHWHILVFVTSPCVTQLKDPTSVSLELPKPIIFKDKPNWGSPHTTGLVKAHYVYWNYQDIMELCWILQSWNCCMKASMRQSCKSCKETINSCQEKDKGGYHQSVIYVLGCRYIPQTQ